MSDLLPKPQLKFRVWAFDKMQTPKKDWGGDVFLRLDGTPYVQTDVEENTGLALLEDCIVMQWTGLKDRNGKEIFDGDIIRKHARGKVPELVGEVDWNAYTGEWVCFDLIHDEEFEDILDFRPEMIEVIGNIYEDAELLPKTNPKGKQDEISN